MLEAQPKEFPSPAAYDSTGRDTFMISNSGTIIMNGQGLTQEELEAERKRASAKFTPVAPTWTPVE